MWKENNKEKQSKFYKEWYQKNRKRLIRERVKYYRKKYRSDPVYRKKVLEKSKEYAYKRGQRRLRLRFEIFKRDKFACQYCGRQVPSIILQIDHIHPKSKGGLNNALNYKSACADCNVGKSDILL